MPKFGIDSIGPSRPLFSISEAIVCEEAGTSQVDSPPKVNPETTPVSPQVTTTPEPAPPTQPEASTVPPADDPSSEEDPQTREETTYQQLALPLVLTERPHWTTVETRRKIERDCGEDGNRKCRQCGRKFTTTRQLRVHVPQHYTNIFCPCGKFSFQQDYHQSTTINHAAPKDHVISS